MPAPFSIVVIIPAYEAEGIIARAVEALSKQTLPRESYEVIVVDDGSKDRTAEVAEAAGARVIRQANAGPAAARNHGVRESAGELIVFTDADCEPEPDLLERLTAPLAEDPDLGATKGAYWSRQREPCARLVQLEYESRYDLMAKVQERRGGIDFIDTYAACFRREVFEAVGGFDESFRTASTEDQELSFRLAERGVRMRFIPEARVWHRHVGGFRGYGRKKRKIGFFKVAVLRRHPGRAVRDSHTPQGLKLEVALAGAFWVSLGASLLLLLFGAGPTVFGGPAVLLALLLLLGAPFHLRVARKEPTLLPYVPAFLLIRATALGVGLVEGFLRGTRLADGEAPG